MEELIYSIDWGQVKTAFDIFMWGDPNFPVVRALEPTTWVAIGSAVISAGTAIGQSIAAKKRRKKWLKQYNKRISELDAQKITNPFEGMTNPYEDLTVNQKQARFLGQQQQQGLATTMRALRPAAGTSGAAVLAQSIANQQTKGRQQISGLIGAQEAANEKIIAGGEMKVQMAEAQGEDVVQMREQQIALAKAGMAQQGYMNAQARSDQASANLGYSIGSAVGNVSGALQMENYNKQMDALGGQFQQQQDNLYGGQSGAGYEITGTGAGGSTAALPPPSSAFMTTNTLTGFDANAIAASSTTLPAWTADDETMRGNYGYLGNTAAVGGTIGAGGTTTTSTVTQHTVLKGETLYSLAKRYNTSEAEIKRLNNLPSDAITINQILTIESKN